jgi:hypothetical protein
MKHRCSVRADVSTLLCQTNWRLQVGWVTSQGGIQDEFIGYNMQKLDIKLL